MMTALSADILVCTETHWSQTTHQAWSYPIRPYSLRQTAATASPNWRGVAIFTSEEMSRHIQSTTTAIYEDGREMGTALKVVLGFHRRRVHLIGAYVPTASPTNMADRTRTQQIVHEWLTAALDAGDEFILAGDLNEHLFEENRSNPTQLGRFLRASSEVKEVWQACPRMASLPGHTFPRNARCQPSKLDFTYLSASLAHGVRQAALMHGQSAIDEDHYALFAEVSVP
ncbi:hypothetical protein IWW35_005565, partial [Coemansia sp. RSA 1878]